jgi:hypothetical protein
MAGRPKIQFQPHDGEEVWALVKFICERRQAEDQAAADQLNRQLSQSHPNLRAHVDVRPLAAPALVLDLLRKEAKRLGRDD